MPNLYKNVHGLNSRKSESEWGQDLLLGDSVRYLAAALECDSADDGVEGGGKNSFLAGAMEILRLKCVSRAIDFVIIAGYKHTSFGFHLVTLSSPYRCAIGANRDLSNTLSFASCVRPGRPSSAGWV
jgi:hypothetical protein